MLTLGETIKKYKKENSLTLKSFGDKINYTASQVSDLQSGRRIPQKEEILNNLANALELTFGEVKDISDYSRFVQATNNESETSNEGLLKLARTVYDSKDLSPEKMEKIYNIIKNEGEFE